MLGGHKHSIHKFGSVQFSLSVASNSLWPHGLQHARRPCPSPLKRIVLKLSVNNGCCYLNCLKNYGYVTFYTSVWWVNYILERATLFATVFSFLTMRYLVTDNRILEKLYFQCWKGQGMERGCPFKGAVRLFSSQLSSLALFQHRWPRNCMRKSCLFV